jgi:hypothetical protein
MENAALERAQRRAQQTILEDVMSHAAVTTSFRRTITTSR